MTPTRILRLFGAHATTVAIAYLVLQKIPDSKQALPNWQEAIRCGRIELSQEGSRPAMVLEARGEGGLIKMRTSAGPDSEDGWGIILKTEFMQGSSIEVRDHLNPQSGSRIILGMDTRNPASSYVEIRDRNGVVRFRIVGWGGEGNFESVRLTDEFGKILLGDPLK